MTPDFFEQFPPKAARMHEAYGPARDVFAMVLAAQLNGPVIWVRQNWSAEQLNPIAMSNFIDPARVLIAQSASHIDALAVAEEALREKAVAFVVLELHQSLDLTAGRRLQLAANAGKTTGLSLIQDGQGSNAAQTRWQCDPVFAPNDSTLMRWQLKKNKSGTLGVWHVRWLQSARSIRLVSPPRK